MNYEIRNMKRVYSIYNHFNLFLFSFEFILIIIS